MSSSDKRAAKGHRDVSGQNDLAVFGDEPTFDADGYPTAETERTISEWAYADGYHSLLAYVARAWRYPDYFQANGNEYRLSTGGWSGNESLIHALQQNRVFWALCWESSRCGGHYVFTVPARSVPDGNDSSSAGSVSKEK